MATEKVYPGMNVPPQPLDGGKAIMHHALKKFVGTADILAQDILNKEPSQQPRPQVIHHYHSGFGYGWSTWDPIFYPTHRTIVIDSSNNRRDKSKEKDNGALVVLGVAAVVVGLVATFATGSALSRYNDSKEALNSTHEFASKLPFYSQALQNDDPALVIKANDILPVQERLCKRIKNSAMTDLFLRSVTLGASVATAVGTFATVSPAILTAGLITGSTAVVGMLFKAGYESVSSNDARDAMLIRDFVHMKS